MKRTELLDTLKTVLVGVFSGESPLAGMDCFMFQGDMVQTYNNNLSISHPLDTGIVGGVKAAELVQILERIKVDTLEMKIAGNSLSIKAGGTKLSMKLVEGLTSPVTKTMLEDLEWWDIPGDFTTALEMTLPSVSKLLSHGALLGIRVEDDEVFSCDNLRVSWYTMGEGMASFTIPGKSVADLLKIKELISYSATDNWVHFMNSSGVVFSSRVIGTEYPVKSLKKFFPEKKTGEVHTIPDGVDQALDRASIMATIQDDGSTGYLTLSSHKGKILIKGEREFGSIIEEVDSEGMAWPEDMELSIQPKFLSNILKHTRFFRDCGNTLVFESQNFKHLVSKILTPKGDDDGQE